MVDFSALDFSAPLQPSTPRRPWPNHSLHQVPCGCTWRRRHPTRKTTLMSALWEHETISNMNSSIPPFTLYRCVTLRLGCVQKVPWRYRLPGAGAKNPSGLSTWLNRSRILTDSSLSWLRWTFELLIRNKYATKSFLLDHSPSHIRYFVDLRAVSLPFWTCSLQHCPTSVAWA